MNHAVWRQYDCNIGPWPMYLDTHSTEGKHVYIERQYLGMYYRTDEPSGIYLRSLQQRARIKIESLIATEQYL